MYLLRKMFSNQCYVNPSLKVKIQSNVGPVVRTIEEGIVHINKNIAPNIYSSQEG